MKRRPRLALTSGEPAGIGPDLCIQLAAATRDSDFDIVCFGDANLLAQRSRMTGLPLEANLAFTVQHVALPQPVHAGRLDPRNARAVLQMLDLALDGCRNGEFDAMVTAPVQKSVINDAGIAFTGHTEYLAERCGVPRPVMLLACDAMKVALVTTHLPLSQVSSAITAAVLDETIAIVDHDLRRLWGLQHPRIAVCGLNPHAGESGHLGREEIDTIAPAIQRAVQRGIDASGPWPADTLFTSRQLANFDVVLAMYHDQGLPTLKHASFGNAVNVTLGLPVLRTSVDHGTALDLAGTGRADVGSLVAAVELAAQLGRTATR
ncbi:MAG: 4-hydroxythreonine-4-phosphate dehydrogenase PdxA [Pseudomonadota bacterium]